MLVCFRLLSLRKQFAHFRSRTLLVLGQVRLRWLWLRVLRPGRRHLADLDAVDDSLEFLENFNVLSLVFEILYAARFD